MLLCPLTHPEWLELGNARTRARRKHELDRLGALMVLHLSPGSLVSKHRADAARATFLPRPSRRVKGLT